jgi:hypothetical protein
LLRCGICPLHFSERPCYEFDGSFYSTHNLQRRGDKAEEQQELCKCMHVAGQEKECQGEAYKEDETTSSKVEIGASEMQGHPPTPRCIGASAKADDHKENTTTACAKAIAVAHLDVKG